MLEVATPAPPFPPFDRLEGCGEPVVPAAPAPPPPPEELYLDHGYLPADPLFPCGGLSWRSISCIWSCMQYKCPPPPPDPPVSATSCTSTLYDLPTSTAMLMSVVENVDGEPLFPGVPLVPELGVADPPRTNCYWKRLLLLL